MALTSLETLSLVAPEFDSVAEDTRSSMLTLAADQLTSAAWGSLYQQAAVRLAAHMLTLRQRAVDGAAGAGPIVSQEAGRQKLSYGAVVGVLNADAKIATTVHGIEYLNLRARVGTSACPGLV